MDQTQNGNAARKKRKKTEAHHSESNAVEGHVVVVTRGKRLRYRVQAVEENREHHLEGDHCSDRGEI